MFVLFYRSAFTCTYYYTEDSLIILIVNYLHRLFLLRVLLRFYFLSRPTISNQHNMLFDVLLFWYIDDAHISLQLDNISVACSTILEKKIRKNRTMMA
jgi:hypothetical protein